METERDGVRKKESGEAPGRSDGQSQGRSGGKWFISLTISPDSRQNKDYATNGSEVVPVLRLLLGYRYWCTRTSVLTSWTARAHTHTPTWHVDIVWPGT